MSKQSKQFIGTGIALVTPFLKNGNIDFKSLEKIVNHVIKGKCDYLVALGSTGESAVLSREERKQVLDCVVKTTNKRLPVVLGLGGNNTLEILRAYDDYNFNGVDAILSVSPYYNKPSQEGIIKHYKTISKAPVPLILYNVPSRTGSNMKASTTLEIAHTVSNIIGMKEASGDFEQTMFIIRDKPKDFLVISGDDAITLPLIAVGAEGVISVIGNAYPKEWSTMVNLALKGDFEKAKKIHYKLLPFLSLIFAEGNPAGVKSALQCMGICEDGLRLPLTQVSKQLAVRISQFVNF